MEGVPANVSGPWSRPEPYSSCNHNLTTWEQSMNQMYSYFYMLLFIPGLLLNSTALWFLCTHIRKKTKAAIFMINLALADLAHILSLPLRIHYYFTQTWPFGHGMCLVCFYLKYLNMYAAIVFLVCISVQRCAFLLHPFAARKWRQRYDLLISVVVWALVSLACSPFILMRSSSGGGGGGISSGTAVISGSVTNMSYTPGSASPLLGKYNEFFLVTWTAGPGGLDRAPKATSPNGGCFKDLPMRSLNPILAVVMIALAELFGFLIPLACIAYSSIRIAHSLKKKCVKSEHNLNSPRTRSRPRLQSVSSVNEEQVNGEKRHALRMVLSCFLVFLFCFAPYHLNFLLYLMASQKIVSHCDTILAVRRFHPVSLCLANLSCCLNPVLYYFLTADFKLRLTKRTSSSSSSHVSSPILSKTPRPTAPECGEPLVRVRVKC